MKRKNILIIYVFIAGLSLLMLSPRSLYADLKDKNAEIYLKNGDRISGKIIADESDKVVVNSESLGELSVKREVISRIVTEEGKKAAELAMEIPKLWKKDIALGYSLSAGNTKKSSANMDMSVTKKTERDEVTLKGTAFYSSSDSKMDAQKWYTMARYGFNIWNKKTFSFYKLETDHDRFADISYRVIPSLGLGYWFSDTPDWKAMTEVGVGVMHTNYNGAAKTANEAVLVPRAFFDRRLFGGSRLTEDITLYPSLKSTGDYRLHSETVLSNPINEQLSLKFSLVKDYNSEPPAGKKKSDSQILSSLNYSF